MSGFSPFLSRCVSKVPPSTDVVVDVSNMKDEQLQALRNQFSRPLYVSTHKSFNVHADKKTSESHGPGTLWLVLRTPLHDKGATKRAVYDPTRQRFVKRTSSSPVHISYKRHSSPSSCSIGTDRVSSDFRHSNCEVDDQVILFLALQRDLTVVTNDRALGRRVAADRAFTLTKDMADLMKHTHLTMLRRDETDTLWIEV